MIKKKQLAIAIAATFAASGVVYAQQPQVVEKVEVTGSNIKRSQTEGATPITVITREDIVRSGATSLNDTE